MPKSKFLTDKNKQKEFLTKVAKTINNYYESINSNKRVTVEEMMKKCEDPERLKRFEKCRAKSDEVEELKQLGKSIESKYNLKVDKGYVRHYHHFLKLPKGNEQEREEIEKNNYEIIKKLSDPASVNEMLKQDLKMLYDCDKMKFFPKDADEAIDTYINDSLTYETSFVISTMFSNGGKYVSNEIHDNFTYYQSFLESGNFLKLEHAYYASEFSLFMPEDLGIDDIIALNGILAPMAYNETDLFTNNAYDSYIQERSCYFQREKTVDLEKKFVEEHDKDHKMLYNLDIGGTSFEDQIKLCVDEKKEPEVQHNFSNVKESLEEDPIPQSKHDFTSFYQGRKKTINELENGRVTSKNFRSTYINEKTNQFFKGKEHEIIAIYNFAKSAKSKDAPKLRKVIEKAFDQLGVSKKHIAEYSSLVNGEYPHKYVDSYDENGINFKANTPKEVTNLYKLNTLRVNNAQELEEKSKQSNFKDNVTEHLSYAKIAKERSMKRGLLSRFFTSEGRAERRIIDKARKDAVANGMSKDDFNNLIIKNDEEFNKQAYSNDAVTVKNDIQTRKIIEIKELDEEIVSKEKVTDISKIKEIDLEKSSNIEIDINQL